MPTTGEVRWNGRRGVIGNGAQRRVGCVDCGGRTPLWLRLPPPDALGCIHRAAKAETCFRSPYLIPSPMLPATSIAPWPERGVDAASTLGGCRTIVSRLSCGRPSGLKAAPRGQVSRACCSCRHHVGPRAVPARSAWPGRRSAQTSACWCAPPAATGDRSRSACLGNTPSRCAPPFHQSSGGAGMIRPPDASGQQAGFRAGFRL